MKKTIYRLRKEIMRKLSPSSKEDILNKAFFYCGINRLEGAYYEFGVYKGDSLIIADYFNAYYSREFGVNHQIYGFDSFEGLPPIKNKEDKNLHFKRGQFSFSRGACIQKLRAYGCDLKNIDLIGGFFSESLKVKRNYEKASIVMIDCDLYTSARDALKFITPYLQNGSILCFDDWYHYKGDPLKGEQKACYDWLNDNPQISISEFHAFGWSGKSFVVRINENAK